MKKYILLFILFYMSFITVYSNINGKNNVDGLKEYYKEEISRKEYRVVKAKILDITYDDTSEERPNVAIESDIRYQHLKIKLLDGQFKGETFTLRNTIYQINPYKLIFKKGEKILLYQYSDKNGKMTGLKIFERSKENYIYFISGLFMLLLFIIGGIKGLKSILTILLTLCVVIFMLLPLLLKGYNPIFLAIIAVIIISALTLFILNGFNEKSYCAIFGTVSGVALGGGLAYLVGDMSHLVGLGSEEAQNLVYVMGGKILDYRGILFCGIIIGSLGAVMDVALSISSAIWEIKEINPDINKFQLIKSGMNIGRDIMGSMSNTLILAYTGGSIQLLLLFIALKMDPKEVINLDIITTEIIRSICGSIGLILSIPLTVWISVFFHEKNKKK